jgi:signal transduction histidine kinase
MRTLIVDDDADIRAKLRRVLADSEYEVVAEGADGQAAYRLVASHRPELVLLDVSMPTGSGAETTMAVRSNFADVRVVALSSFADAADVSTMMAAGASGYVLKSAPPHEVLTGLRAALLGRPLLGADVLQQVLHDLTQLYRQQRARADGLAEIDSMKRTFLSLVNDQLRTPLTAITGTLATLTRGWDRLDDVIKREFLDSVTAQAERLNRRIDQIAMVANLSREPQPRDKAAFSLDGVAREACVAVDHRFTERDLDVSLEAVTVVGDRTAVLTAAKTLLANAADHTSGPVGLQVEARDGQWGALSVSDQGSLTADEMRRLAAESFQPADPSDTRETEGLGLSLYLARRLLELDGGRLEIKPASGGGSVFAAVLPLAE